MTIDASTRRLALIRILRARRLGRGQSLPLAELQFAWLRTGLRETDLHQVLRDMKAHGLVDLDHDFRGPRLRLTAAGQGEARWPAAGLVGLIVDWLRLRRVRARRRERQAVTELKVRRVTDSRRGHRAAWVE